MEWKNFIRKNIWDLQPYLCARNEYNGEAAVLLDANENPYANGFNRYPDPEQRLLKKKLAELKRVNVENIVLGNGSDEVIDLLIRSICEPVRDRILVFSPGYSMYEVSAAINQVGVEKINLTTGFLPDWSEMWKRIDKTVKIIFLCTPNNPVGKAVPLEQIEEVCQRFAGLVVVDEAYIDFSEIPSTVPLMPDYPNLMVMQTLSKAWGMAGLRLGIGMGDPELICVLNKVRAPYNINSLTQQAAIEVLGAYEDFAEKVRVIKAERDRLIREFRKIRGIDRVYDSDANFVLVTSREWQRLYAYLAEEKVIVRLRNIPPLIPGGIRISVGTPAENERLLELLKRFNLSES